MADERMPPFSDGGGFEACGGREGRLSEDWARFVPPPASLAAAAAALSARAALLSRLDNGRPGAVVVAGMRPGVVALSLRGAMVLIVVRSMLCPLCSR